MSRRKGHVGLWESHVEMLPPPRGSQAAGPSEKARSSLAGVLQVLGIQHMCEICLHFCGGWPGPRHCQTLPFIVFSPRVREGRGFGEGWLSHL